MSSQVLSEASVVMDWDGTWCKNGTLGIGLHPIRTPPSQLLVLLQWTTLRSLQVGSLTFLGVSVYFSWQVLQWVSSECTRPWAQCWGAYCFHRYCRQSSNAIHECRNSANFLLGLKTATAAAELRNSPKKLIIQDGMMRFFQMYHYLNEEKQLS